MFTAAARCASYQYVQFIVLMCRVSRTGKKQQGALQHSRKNARPVEVARPPVHLRKRGHTTTHQNCLAVQTHLCHCSVVSVTAVMGVCAGGGGGFMEEVGCVLHCSFDRV